MSTQLFRCEDCSEDFETAAFYEGQDEDGRDMWEPAGPEAEAHEGHDLSLPS